MIFVTVWSRSWRQRSESVLTINSQSNKSKVFMFLPTCQHLCLTVVQPQYHKKNFIKDVLWYISDYIEREKCCRRGKTWLWGWIFFAHTWSYLAVRIVPCFFLWVFVCILSSDNAPYCAALFDSVDWGTQIFTWRTVKWPNKVILLNVHWWGDLFVSYSLYSVTFT